MKSALLLSIFQPLSLGSFTTLSLTRTLTSCDSPCSPCISVSSCFLSDRYINPESWRAFSLFILIWYDTWRCLDQQICSLRNCYTFRLRKIESDSGEYFLKPFRNSKKPLCTSPAEETLHLVLVPAEWKHATLPWRLQHSDRARFLPLFYLCGS